MRQEDKGKQRVANEGEGGKEAEVSQEVALCEEQAHESADGGEAAQENGRRLFPEHLLCISHVIKVDEHVQAVADGYTQHNSADTQGHERHITLNPIHAGHGEQGAVQNRYHLLP